MSNDELHWRCGIVGASVLLYWGGVWLQARRVRRHIGRSPNLKPRGAKEKALWLGWFLVILVWVGQPIHVGFGRPNRATALFASVTVPASLALGIVFVLAGYLGTLWCYAAMGDTWRIGINPKEKTTLVNRGPYRRVRHPIYLFQIVMLAGAALLLPTISSLGILALHFVCVRIKAVDEERYLASVHGDTYQEYLRRTGRLLPKF